MSAAFYDSDGERFLPTQWSRGPWSPDHQHGGPPSALLGRAIEALHDAEWAVARVTVELLRSVPLRPLTVHAAVVRPGRRVQLTEATLRDDAGDVALARAWVIRRGDTSAEQTAVEPPPRGGPEAATETPVTAFADGPSYFAAMEWRFAAGDITGPGPATVWMRMRGDLVAGEPPSPLTRVLVAADSGNGVSAEVSWRSHLFINTELTAHLYREPEGEWICLDSRTGIGPQGAGVATTSLFDHRGGFGSSQQALLVSTR